MKVNVGNIVKWVLLGFFFAVLGFIVLLFVTASFQFVEILWILMYISWLGGISALLLHFLKLRGLNIPDPAGIPMIDVVVIFVLLVILCSFVPLVYGVSFMMPEFNAQFSSMISGHIQAAEGMLEEMVNFCTRIPS